MWTPTALASERRTYAGTVWRVVEAQHRASTMRLVDSNEEQAQLETLIEQVKPAYPPGCEGLHYLLATPFRYGAPYPVGSRFRRAGRTAGVFYASEAVATAMAETAFYLLLFLSRAPEAAPPARPLERTAFSAGIDTLAALDLTAAPLSRDGPLWRDPTGYSACQDLADAAREAGATLLRYTSVRDPSGGCNVALLSPVAFAAKAPLAQQTWRLLVRKTGVRAVRDFGPDALDFPRAAFNDPRLADPASG
jgi:hypothetical protein